MHRTIVIVALVFVMGGCATVLKPELHRFQSTELNPVYPHLAALMELEGDLPPRAECPINFAVLDTSALNAWVSVYSEPRRPPPRVKTIGEVSPPDPTPPAPPRCRQFDLIVTSGALALPPDELRAVLAHELGHVYLGHIQSVHTAQMLQTAAEVFVVGIIPFLVMHSGTYPFMSTFSRSQETAADRFAVDLLVRARSSCRALVGVLERFQQAQALSSKPRFEWLSTHPFPERRLETVRERCGARPGPERISGPHSHPRHPDR